MRMVQNPTPYTKPIFLKLNTRFFLCTLWFIIRINIILTICLATFALLRSEYTIKNRFDNGSYVPSSVSLYSQTERKGVRLPGFLQTLLPLDSPDAVRLFIPVLSPDKGRLRDLVYRISLPHGFSEYSFAQDINYATPLLIIFGLLQLIMFFSLVVRNQRYTSHTLAPIYEIINTANKISPTAQQLAGQISNIQANDLQIRIPVEQQPLELKPLAEEINGLLGRVYDAYNAQVRFVSDAAHELRTPIAVIQGYAKLLDRWGKSDPKALEESIQAIKSEAESMKYLIEQLHFLAKGENDTLQLNKINLDVSQLAQETVNEMKLIDSEHVYQLQLENNIIVNADKDLIKQMLRIFLENSRKYSPNGQIITVRTTRINGVPVMSVQDDGIGIDPSALPYVFERFYRSDQSRARTTGGSGLGLAIAKMIAHHHTFTLSIISRLNIGTRIELQMH